MDYTTASAFRFLAKDATEKDIQSLHKRLMNGEVVNMESELKQPSLLNSASNET
jgi:hypothetical protein